MAQEGSVVRRGIYNVEYFSGAQVSLYIGSIWVDEITTLSYGYIQNRMPIYGYASTLYDDLTEGQILVQGTFTINFKEAGYLWLILNHYRGKKGLVSLMEKAQPFQDSGNVMKQTVERLINHELSTYERNKAFEEIAVKAKDLVKEARYSEITNLGKKQDDIIQGFRERTAAGLGSYASDIRAAGGIGSAENFYEAFEDAVWGGDEDSPYLQNRRPDDPRLNPFDIYVAFGDFAGDNRANHTIERIKNVTILGKSKQIVIDGMPIQESYQFIGREQI